ncbi:hypothetical protein [Embleya sp. NPDC059259]|uniref:hypothetical protein n=1 Tax=unclassified Embleya TaxID=2699296 RepID=UPI003675DF3E
MVAQSRASRHVRRGGGGSAGRPWGEEIDRLPTDPWLRVHVKAGGTIERIAPPP